MTHLRNLIRLGLPWMLCVACQPSNLPADGGSSNRPDGAPPVGAEAVPLFGPTGFSDALKSAQSPMTCNTAEEWRVNPAGAMSLSTLEYRSLTNSPPSPITCTFRMEVPIPTTVDFGQFPKGIILFENNYKNVLGALNLTVHVNNDVAVDYLGKTASTPTQASLGGSFKTVGIPNGKLPMQFAISFTGAVMSVYQGDNWIVSNVFVYAAR